MDVNQTQTWDTSSYLKDQIGQISSINSPDTCWIMCVKKEQLLTIVNTQANNPFPKRRVVKLLTVCRPSKLKYVRGAVAEMTILYLGC